MLPFFIFVTVFLLCAYLVTRVKKEGSGNWVQFFAKGKEAGFTAKDMEQLRQLVSICNIKEPISIFRSQKQFEIIIRSMINTIRMSGERNDPSIDLFLSKLFDYFKKIEMNAAEVKSRISTTRQISEGQVLRVLVPGTGVYKSEVIKNAGQYLTIARPINSKLTTALQWHGIRISVYFWREEDAGYVFDTDVVDEVFSKGISSLKVEHNDSLFRTQKRKSLRVKFKRAAFLYTLNDDENPHKLETTPGLRCMLNDISDSGCAFNINGQAEAGLRLKVQFSIDRIPICMPATVRSVDYNQDTNSSLVRMEADPLPIAVRNHILCEVFHMREDEDEELPFRILEEEADSRMNTVKEAASA